MLSLKDSRLHPAILLAICAVVFFYNFQDRALWTSGEDRAAQIAVEMNQTGNWIVPHLNDEVTLTKPPLLHWLIAICYRLFGTGELSARLPSALAGTGAVLLVYLLGARMWDRSAGLVSALVLATSMEFIWHGRCARIDMLFTFLVLASLASFYFAYGSKHPSRTRYLPFFAFAALATLAKGPAGLLLPVLTVFIFLGMRRDFTPMKQFACWQGLLLLVAIALPWYVAIILKAPPDKVRYFFFGQMGEWAAGRTHRPAEPFGHQFVYLVYLIKGFFPWVLYLPLVCVQAVKKLKRRGHPELLFLLVWFGVGLVGFSLFSTKAARYILPIYPAAALLVGASWRQAMAPSEQKQRRWIFGLSIAVVATTLLVMAALIAAALLEPSSTGKPIAAHLHKLAGETFPYILVELGTHMTGLLLVAIGFGVLGVAALLKLKQRQIACGLALLVLLLTAQVGFFVLRIVPGMERYYNARDFCKQVNSAISRQSRLATCGHWHYWMRFYLRRHVERIVPDELVEYLGTSKDSYCLINSSTYEKLSERGRLVLHVVRSFLTEGQIIYLVNRRPPVLELTPTG